MPSQIIDLKSGDLSALNGAHIEKCEYDPSGQIMLTLGHVIWPNDVMVRIKIGMSAMQAPIGSVTYQPMFVLFADDIIDEGKKMSKTLDTCVKCGKMVLKDYPGASSDMCRAEIRVEYMCDLSIDDIYHPCIEIEGEICPDCLLLTVNEYVQRVKKIPPSVILPESIVKPVKKRKPVKPTQLNLIK